MSETATSLTSLTFAQVFGRMGDLPDLVSLPVSTSISDALAKMAQVGVRQIAVTSTESDKVIAIVGFFDAVHYIVREYTKGGMTEEDGEKLLSSSLDNLLSIDPTDESYRVWERDVNDTIAETLKAFGSGLHRAYITDVTGKKAPHIFSQTDVISYLAYHPEVSSVDLAGTTLEQAKLTGKAVVTLPDSATALEGFKLLVEKKLLAVPVTDSDGQLLGTLATADLRGMTPSTLSALSSPVLDFIASRRFVHLGAGASRPSATATTSLKDVIDTMVRAHAHRVWVTDDKDCVKGVVSQSDVIRAVSA